MAGISAGEVAVYDRQLRLWGVQAQQRLMQSHVLIWGLEGSNVEACKNLVLAGVSLTVRDHRATKAEDVAFNYFLREGDIGQGRASCSAARVQEMNPLNKVASSDAAPEADDEGLKSALADFDVVLVAPGVLGWNMELACKIDEACRAKGACFFLLLDVGQLAFFFSDMGAHEVRERSVAQGGAGGTAVEPTAAEPETIVFPSLKEWLSTSLEEMVKDKVDASVVFVSLIAKFLQSDEAKADGGPSSASAGTRFEAFCKSVKCLPAVDGLASLSEAYGIFLVEPLVHVASVLGGLLAQEVVKAITKRDVPLANSVCFSAFTNAAVVERLPAPAKVLKRKAEEAALDLDSD